MSIPSNTTRPSACAPGVISCIRFKHLKSVVFPQPDGPIKAVTDFSLTSRLTSFIARLFPYQPLTFSILTLNFSALSSIVVFLVSLFPSATASLVSIDSMANWDNYFRKTIIMHYLYSKYRHTDHEAALNELLRAKNLKPTLMAKIINIKTRADPQPKACADSYGWLANLQILSGKASTGPVIPVKKRLVPNIVIISGAVSPAILDMAKTMPVRIPCFALGRTMDKVIFAFDIPREWPASRSEYGTIFKVSSVTLTTIGIIIIDRETAPAKTEKEPMDKTMITYPTMPITIDGSPVSTSLKNLTESANIPSLANSDRYIPARTPTGAAIKDASPTTMIVPCMAGPTPPLPEPIDP